MGNNQSNHALYCKLYHVMPPVNTRGSGKGKKWFNAEDDKPFADENDRNQFIYATITVLSRNGTIDLNNHDLRILYSRRENDRIVARIVAEKDGMIKTNIEPPIDGKDQAEAFKGLRRHIEMMLDYILSDVPGSTTGRSPSSPDIISGFGPSAGPAGPAAMPAQSAIGSRSAGSRVSTITISSGPRSVQSDRTESLISTDEAPRDAPPAYGKAVKEWKTSEEKKG